MPSYDAGFPVTVQIIGEDDAFPQIAIWNHTTSQVCVGVLSKRATRSSVWFARRSSHGLKSGCFSCG
jgi:hypothetical protein